MRALYITGCMLLLAACTPESSTISLQPLPTAAFTATPLSGNPNKVAVQSTTPGGFIWLWNYGTNGISRKASDTLSFSKKGEYTIQLTVFTHGGYATTAQKVNIANDLPAVDILKGGDMSPGSEAFWTVLNTGGTQTAIAIANGMMTFSNTGNSNGAIYQAVTVKKDREYTFSAHIKGGGAADTWFEVVFGTAAPEQGKDYSGTKFIAMNTWSGCGNAPFDGEFAVIACDGDGKGKDGKIKFDKDGTVYMVIKGGSTNNGTLGPDGITLDNIRFLEEQ
ncbi:PKD domain-containing protein [Chitinophaga sp. XS-30]|uniref:PKD domain-containing protein n=1 Tax=Chitinophaga sp. XS-30 TaxID=2604421 RepID=UPI0011DDA3AF|nr:PKD domain-containing protein [Chitinophaga sp. XS-30]QEH42218.1 hypothetical protein FW415_15590 [Chitinophaga sp. XS-30]